MLMTLLYIPCIATIAVIKQEAGIRWAVIATVWSIFIGWLVATLFYQGFRLY
jgi:ferrous iron transport protein B